MLVYCWNKLTLIFINESKGKLSISTYYSSMHACIRLIDTMQYTNRLTWEKKGEGLNNMVYVSSQMASSMPMIKVIMHLNITFDFSIIDCTKTQTLWILSIPLSYNSCFIVYTQLNLSQTQFPSQDEKELSAMMLDCTYYFVMKPWKWIGETCM